MSRGKMLKNWCFTDWPTDDNDDWPLYNDADMAYMVVGKEICPDTQKQHWQGFVQLRTRQRMSTVKKYFSEKVHLEATNGTPEQAAAYCKKDGNFQEHGTIVTQGKRSDISNAKSLLDSGATITQVADECFGVFLRYSRALVEYQQLKLPTDRTVFTKNYCTILWGDTGSGKSRTAYNCDSFQVIKYDPVGRFFSAPWDGSRRVIIDDVCPETFRPRDLWLNILDPYSRQLRINVKGAYSKFAPVELYVTSNFDPVTWIPGDTALQRRLDEFCTIRHMVGFVDGPMRRFFTTPVALPDTDPVYISDSDSGPECDGPVEWADTESGSDGESDGSSAYSRSVRSRLVSLANKRSADVDYVGATPRPERVVRTRYIEHEAAEESEDSLDNQSLDSTDYACLAASRMYERGIPFH